MEIRVEPIPLLTIYGEQSDEEAYVIAHPESTAAFMTDWRRSEIEGWTYLQPEYAHSFMDAQTAWVQQGGELFASDCLRTINTQIKLKARKPTLAAKPGTSLHGLGMAIDYDTERLGKIGGKRMTFREFDEHLRKYGWRVHGRAFRSSSHAEAWHIQPTEFRGQPFESNMEVCRILMEEEGPKIKGMEDFIILELCSVAGWSGLSPLARIKRIQGMGGLTTDGIVGPKTRGYLALLAIKYNRVPSTYAGGGQT